MTQKIVMLVAVFVGLGLVSSAMASPTVKLESGLYQSGSGGEFKATVMSGDLAGHPVGFVWQTFCVEGDEYVSLPGTYNAEVNTYAVQGGVGGPSPDPLDPRTAWLYTQFLNGTLLSYDYSSQSARTASAGALQDAIWYIEQEITTLPTGLATNFFNQATVAGWTNIGDIRVLNLTNPNGGLAQDVLISAVPAPGAMLLVGIGTAVIGAYRRRMA